MSAQRAVCLLFLVGIVCCANLGMYNDFKVPSGWKMERRADYRDHVTIYVAVKQQSTKTIQEIADRVSDPQSEYYGDYITKSHVDRILHPTYKSLQVVTDWLSYYDVQWFQQSPDWVVVETNAIRASELLNTEFYVFKQQRTGFRTIKASTTIDVPKSLVEHVDFIGGATDFPEAMNFDLSTRRRLEFSSNENVILYMSPGDTELRSFFLPICGNGKPSLEPQTPCSDQGGAIQSITQIHSQFGSEHSQMSSASELSCKSCLDWEGQAASYCRSTNRDYNFHNSTVYCYSPLIARIKNYYEVQYSLYTSFSSGDSAIATWTDAPIFLGKFVTPSMLLERYGVPTGREICKQTNNSQAVAEFSGQGYSPSDLNYFFDAMSVVPAGVIVNGTNRPQHPTTEASLDIEFLMGVAQNVTTTYWKNGRGMLGWIVHVLNAFNPPLVHSVSYGENEAKHTAEYLTRINVEFQKAASMGLTLIFASGDNGVNNVDFSAPNCTESEQFSQWFPASSPYVTAIGGTQFSTQILPVCSEKVIGVPITCSKEGEITCSTASGSHITSGGGFSKYFAQPSYQQDVVANYLRTIGGSIPHNYYNVSNRAYPDVSASAHNYLVQVSGVWDPVDGTSASTPTVAGLISIANDYRIQHGKPPLGFINPLLYQDVYNSEGYTEQYYESYWDITMGDNSCGRLGQVCCPYGFPATRGWDASTGLGSFRNVVNNSQLFPKI